MPLKRFNRIAPVNREHSLKRGVNEIDRLDDSEHSVFAAIITTLLSILTFTWSADLMNTKPWRAIDDKARARRSWQRFEFADRSAAAPHACPAANQSRTQKCNSRYT